MINSILDAPRYKPLFVVLPGATSPQAAEIRNGGEYGLHGVLWMWIEYKPTGISYFQPYDFPGFLIDWPLLHVAEFFDDQAEALEFCNNQKRPPLDLSRPGVLYSR